jgi:hypothetical protein
MTKDTFLKRSYRPYQQMNFIKRGVIIECMVLAVDFDEGIIKLESFETDEIKQAEFWAHHDHCELPERKLKITK